MKPGQVRAAALHHSSRPPVRRYPPGAVAALACPHCGAELAPADGAFRCPAGHAFDISKQGYVALLDTRARTDTADSQDMVAARADFLGAGHYRPIASAVATEVLARQGPFLEIGAGTGYYLGAALDAADAPGSGIALDSSKYAARRAAADPRLISVVADAWCALPIRAGAVHAVLSVFAPRNPAEICRVLAPSGLLVAVTPEPQHLAELREHLPLLAVDDGKSDRLLETFAGPLTPVSQRVVEFEMVLDRDTVSALVRMGPTARHLAADDLAGQIMQLPRLSTVTAAVTVSTLSKR